MNSLLKYKQLEVFFEQYTKKLNECKNHYNT